MHTIPQTILAQLGGRSFIAMTGASNFVASERILSFRLPGNLCRKRINCIRITLEDSDTYRVEFLRIWGHTLKTIADVSDVYADMLREIIEGETGLCLVMPRVLFG